MPGNLINPLIVEGQIHGGLAQGIGQALIEEVVYNSDGQLVTGSFMDYAMPRATDFPRFELDSTVTPTPVNPLGAKGVGEAGTLGSTPSIVCAAVDALSEFGVKHIDMMLRPEKLWRIIHGRQEAGVIPTAFDYHRATSVDDAIRKLQDTGGKLLAGGHSLVPLMKLRLSEPTALIDIARIPGLSGIREKDGQIEIGAATVHHDVATSAVLRQKCPIVSDAAGEIGDPQVRNRGTLGGSLAHADPSADYPAVMLALDAGIQITGPSGSRVVKASDFFQDLFTVDLASDEIITGVQFAPVKSAAYAKLHQRASHYAIVGVAVALDVKNGDDPVGAGRAHRRQLACHAADERRAGARRAAAVGEDDRVGGADRGQGPQGDQRRHPRQRELPPRDDSGLYAARAGRRRRARLIQFPTTNAQLPTTPKPNFQ